MPFEPDKQTVGGFTPDPTGEGLSQGFIPDTPLEAPQPIKGGPADFGKELFKGIPSFFLRAGGGVLGVAEMVIPGNPLEQAIENIESFRERKFPMSRGGWAWTGRVIGEAIPFLAMSIASYGATGSALGPFLTAFTVEGGGAYNEAKSRGVSEWKAKTEGTLIGTINGALEMWGVSKLIKFSSAGKGSMKQLVKSVKNKLWKQSGKELKNISGNMLKSAVVEGLEEMSQEGVSLAVPAAVSKNFPKNPDGSVNFNAIITQIGMAGLGGAVAGGFITGGRSMIAGAPVAAMPTQTEIANYKEKIQNSKFSFKEKEAILNDLDRLGETEPLAIPDDVVNVYRGKETGKIYPETPDGGQTKMEQTPDGGTKIIATDTGEELELTTNLKPLSTYDTTIQELNQAIDSMEKLRPEEEVEISKERGKRFQEYKEVLKDVPNPVVASYLARRALAGELKLQIQPFEHQFSPAKVQVLFEKVRSSMATETEQLAMFKGLQKLFFDGKIPARHEVEALGLVFPKETVAKLISARKRLGQEKFNFFLEGLNIPRSLLASYDVSAALRQGMLLLPRSPKIWAKGLLHYYRAIASEKYAEFIDMQIRTHPRFKQLKKATVILTRVGGLVSGEEMFRSDVASKIPGIGKGVRASERGYVTFLNYLRSQNFYNTAEQWEGKGHSADDYKQLGAYLNHATGRGDIKALGKIMPALSAIFFAPRLQIGRVQVVTDLITKPAVRKMIATDLLTFAGTAMGLLALLSLRRDVEVEHDPRSTDFGKVKIGNTRIDFLGGYQQLIRYTAQLAMGQAKSTVTGRIRPTERGKVIWRFIQSKLSPVAGLTVDGIRGETFLGKQLTAEPEVVSRELYERLVPLFIQDVIDTASDRGWDKTTGIASLAAMHGVGVMTYPVTPGSESARLKDVYSNEMTGRKWDEIGPEMQKMVREYRPQITLMERKARMERENTSFLAAMLKEQEATAKRVTRTLPRNIQNEMERLQVRIPGLSRRVGMDWYLNEKRYKDYERGTAKILNKVLPKLMMSSVWNGLPDEVRHLVINEVVTEAKKITRDNIIHNATMRDIEELVQ